MLDEVINPSGVTVACNDTQTRAHNMILKQSCTVIKWLVTIIHLSVTPKA